MRHLRVAAYCRVSTDSEEQLTSYTNQKKVYTEMIAAKPEWEFADSTQMRASPGHVQISAPSSRR